MGPMTKPQPLADADYQALAAFRYELRRFALFSEQAAAKVGLTPQQHQALLTIRAAGQDGITIGGVAERLLLKPHSATGLVDRLEALGLIERRHSEHDRRRAYLVLTRRTDELLAALSVAHRDEIRRVRPLLAGLLEKLDE